MGHPPVVRASRRKSNEPLPPLRERLKALRHVPSLMALVWQTNRAYTATMIGLRLLRSFLPLASLWVAKMIIDEVILAASTGGDASRVLQFVAIEMAIVVGGELLGRASGLVEGLLGDQVSNRMSLVIMEHAATLDLQQFEDPDFYDQLERARRGSQSRLMLLNQFLGFAQDALTLASLSAALIAHSAWLLVLLAVAVVPSFLGETHFASLAYSLMFQWTPERRQLDYVRYAGASNETAKEVQMFGLAPWLIDRFRTLSDRFYVANKQLAIKRATVSSVFSLIATLGYYAAAIVVVLRAVAGTISIGTLTFLTGSFQRCRGLMQGLLGGISNIYEQTLYLRDLFLFLETKPNIQSKPDALPVPRPIREGFVFENVGFKYPGSERWAVRNVSFALRRHERVALVGENGAGKTTITKLIARLYDPTEGRILLDGVDLRDYDVGDLRRAIAVIFQDFVRYDMRFDENVGVGAIEEVRDYLDAGPVFMPTLVANGKKRDALAAKKADAPPPAQEPSAPTPASITTAAEKSLASSLLPRLPGGYRQMLGRRFGEGIELSGGEWQKVALARAYMRDAELLILDEPTASLDARAEYDVFLRFNELMAGRMAIVISHRFSTVRMADRILVLREGALVEDGTHEELLASAGLYAELFQMQAAGYR
jgi:ATP-binding cassette subfamily B protein